MKILKKIKTLFTLDLFWLYRYARKRIPRYLGFRFARMRGITYRIATIGDVTLKMSFTTPYHYSLAKLDTNNCDPLLLSWRYATGKRIYDIGAYNGIFGLVAAKAHPDAEVVIFEPDNINADVIENNIRINELKNCRLIRAAVTDHEGTVEFPQTGTTSGKIGDKGLTTAAVSLGSLPPADLIKLDIEGAEMRALSTLNYKPTILLEVHPDRLTAMGDSEEKLWNLVTAKGFRSFFLVFQRSAAGEQKHYLLF